MVRPIDPDFDRLPENLKPQVNDIVEWDDDFTGETHLAVVTCVGSNEACLIYITPEGDYTEAIDIDRANLKVIQKVPCRHLACFEIFLKHENRL